ncbi:TolC family outer membrane protein [Pseudomonas sp. PDM23]|uniref:TolC family outer membrane protein n=1 Tax=unclassified Pseudomonas TaxID=196821 RepID=UPI0017844E2E|nr:MULTISPECIES: TolC family outer membrane protein [unclassified Pseudomonas]MBD9578606.1 TolC family outer membrane protein [Pseudomonas sp. PDM23]MBD9674386.1 TolC family outer membrane protein [Pseudomonas sp. PDM21]
MTLAKLFIPLGMCLALAPPGASSGELLSVVNDALVHDAELSAANSEIAIGREEVPIARSALLPRLDGGWGRTYNQITTDNQPTTRYWQNGWMITLTQPVFDWERWVALRQADIASAKAELEYASAWQALVLRSANAYFDLLAAAQEQSRASDYLSAVSEQHALTVKLQAGGEATLIDVQEARSRLSEAQLRQQDALRNLDSRRRVLETLTGRDVTPPAKINLSRTKPWLKARSLQQWVRQAETSSYSVQLGKLEVRNASEDSEKARAQRYPVINLSASHAPSGAAAGYSEPTTTNSAMLTISAPLFTGGANRARLRQTLAEEEKAENRLLGATRKSTADTREWFQRFNWARDRSQALSEIVRLNASSLAATRKGYQAGSRTNLDVLRAQEVLFASRGEQAKANYEMLSAFLALKAEVASLNLGDIQLLDDWLTADASTS